MKFKYSKTAKPTIPNLGIGIVVLVADPYGDGDCASQIGIVTDRDADEDGSNVTVCLLEENAGDMIEIHPSLCRPMHQTLPASLEPV